MNLIPAVIGAIAGQDANRRAQNQANQAMQMQNEVLARRNALFDELKGLIGNAEASGYYDPQKQWDAARAVMDFDQKRAQEASAGASAALGYRPGDSAPLDAQKGISEGFAIKRGALQNDIWRNAWQQRLGDRRALLSDVPMEGLQVGAQRYQQAQNNYVDPTALFQSIMPFLTGGGAKTSTKAPVSPMFGSVPYQIDGYGYNSNPYKR